jgi:hypothetical protein
MKVLCSSIGFLVLISFLGSCLPTRVGKVKSINTGAINRGDSLILVTPTYTYTPFGNYISGSRWDKPRRRQLDLEQRWDSVQYEVFQKTFRVSKLDLHRDVRTYEMRTFKFRVFLGTSESVKADSTSWLLSKFTWHIRAAQPDSAKRYLPQSIYELSFSSPVVIITNDFDFFEKQFVSGYAVGSTGLQFIPDMICAILKKGEVVYFRSYRKRLQYFKVMEDRNKLIAINEKLLDKL